LCRTYVRKALERSNVMSKINQSLAKLEETAKPTLRAQEEEEEEEEERRRLEKPQQPSAGRRDRHASPQRKSAFVG
jgi:hypothetical protein